MWALAAMAALASLQVGLGCAGIQDKAPPFAPGRIDNLPFSAKAKFMRDADEVLVTDISKHPQVFRLRSDRGQFVLVQFDAIFSIRRKLDRSILHEQRSWNKREDSFVIWNWRQSGKNLRSYAAYNQFGCGAPLISNYDYRFDPLWRSSSNYLDESVRRH
jgi:hypothetical protein